MARQTESLLPAAQEQARQWAAGLPLWSGPVVPEPVAGGISNFNFRVTDRGVPYFVRIAGDVPAHGIRRRHEVRMARAAHAAGLSPEVVFAEPPALVLAWIDGRTLSPADTARPDTVARVVPLLRTLHGPMARALPGAVPRFCVFRAIRRYVRQGLRDGYRLAARLPELAAAADRLESIAGRRAPTLTHNDLLAANLIDDGRRLWLVDWDYGGWGDPMFDLANHVADNDIPDATARDLLRGYLGRAPDAAMWRCHAALVAASHLREALWSMTSERHIAIDFDYAAYTERYLAAFAAAASAVEAGP